MEESVQRMDWLSQLRLYFTQNSFCEFILSRTLQGVINKLKSNGTNCPLKFLTITEVRIDRLMDESRNFIGLGVGNPRTYIHTQYNHPGSKHSKVMDKCPSFEDRWMQE